MRRVMLLLLLLLTAAPVHARSTHDTPDAATESQAWWGDMARGYVVSGCLPAVPVPASLTLALPPCQAYALDRSQRLLAYVWEPTARTLTLPSSTGRTWLAAQASVATPVAGWTRLPGTHYVWQVNALTPEPPAAGVLLAAVDVAGSVVTVVGDARPDSPIPGAPANLQSPLFGAKGDCATDDTVALQRWVNNVAWRNTEGYAPASCYKFTRLWLTWDATNNPGFPPDVIERGGYLVRGAGPAQANHVAQDKQRWPGTVWWSTETALPAVTAYSDTTAGTGNAGRGIRLENLSLVQATSSAVLDVDGMHSRSGLRDLFVVQEGSGDGVGWRNTFLSWMEDVFVMARTPASNTGVGVQLQNTLTPGGVIRLVNVTARSFGVACLRAGALATVATRLQTVHMQGVQGGNCPIGLQVWGGVRSLQCTGCYFEGFSDNGVFIKENAQGVSIVNSWFAAGNMTDGSDAAIRIGTGGAGQADAAYAVTIQNNTFVDVLYGSAIWRDVGASTRGAVVLTNHIQMGTTAVAGMSCGSGGITTQNDLLLFGNVFDTTHPQPVAPGCRSGEFIQDGTALWMGRRLNLGQGFTIASAPEIVLPNDGNMYNLTGAATITTLTCATCTPGAFAWFVVPGGNAPVMTEGGNLLLDDTAVPANQWTGAANSVIGLLYTTSGQWVEMHRKDN